MTPWKWHVGHKDSVELEGHYNIDECATRDEAINAGLRETEFGEQFYVIEARSSTDARHEGAETVPFLRTRNKELVRNGPQLAGALS